MKIPAAFALLLVFGVPTEAQPTPPRTETIESELLQLEQDADKTLLSEALLVRGRKAMQQRADAQPGESPALRDFIAEKKRSIIKRSEEMREMRSKSTATKARAAAPLAEADRQKLIEKMANAQVEVQLLQTQSQLYQGALTEAINALATAELVASGDENQRQKVDAARKEYEKAKSRVVEVGKRLTTEQAKLNEMYQTTGFMGGMGMGMGGMGGGMR